MEMVLETVAATVTVAVSDGVTEMVLERDGVTVRVTVALALPLTVGVHDSVVE